MLGKVLAVLGGFVLLAALAGYALFYHSDLSREELAPTYVTEASKFAELPNGASMHYRDEGNPAGPVLVLIHGGFGSLHNWEPWLPYLKADYRLISMDLLGHGLTGKYPANVYDRHTERDAVHQLLQKLGVSRYTIAGNSFGGGIALELALAYPSEVKGLILIAAEGLPNTEEGYDASMFKDDAPLSPDHPEFANPPLTEVIGSKFIGPAVIGASLGEMVHNKKLLTSEFIDRFAQILRHEGNREAQLLMFRQGMYLISKNGKMDLLPRLSEISCPTLVMQGKSDMLVPMRVAELFAKEIPGSELVVIDEAANLPMIEKPEETAQLVKTFLAKHKLCGGYKGCRGHLPP